MSLWGPPLGVFPLTFAFGWRIGVLIGLLGGGQGAKGLANQKKMFLFSVYQGLI